MREENQTLSETNQLLKDELINLFDKLVDPETPNKTFTMVDSLIGGHPVKLPEEMEGMIPISTKTGKDRTKRC